MCMIKPFIFLVFIRCKEFFSLHTGQSSLDLGGWKVNGAMISNENQKDNLRPCWTPRGGTLGISGWGCAPGTLSLYQSYNCSAVEFCFPILE